MNDQTRTLVLKCATVIWIDAEINVLADRVGRRNNRPLLSGKDAKTVLTELAAVRNPVYSLAPIHIRSETLPHDVTVETILEKLR